jgi:hypothetical protein
LKIKIVFASLLFSMLWAFQGTATSADMKARSTNSVAITNETPTVEYDRIKNVLTARTAEGTYEVEAYISGLVVIRQEDGGMIRKLTSNCQVSAISHLKKDNGQYIWFDKTVATITKGGDLNFILTGPRDNNEKKVTFPKGKISFAGKLTGTKGGILTPK